MKFWRIQFHENGSIASVIQLVGDADDSWVIIRAPSEAEAKRRAYNLYCARKKKLAKQRHHAKGECSCGRKQDRKHPDGTLMKTCSVCGEREKVYNDRYNQRVKAGTVGQGMAERDEGARLQAHAERQRDRRAEIRLEVLIEVREQWRKLRAAGAFMPWLHQEIEALANGKKGAAA